MITITKTVSFSHRGGRKCLVEGPRPAKLPPSPRIARVARLMALAIEFDRLLADGTVADQRELSRLVHVTQPRITQILNLNHLAPDIQEELLFLQAPEQGRETLNEWKLRPIAAEVNWVIQRQLWREMAAAAACR